MIQCVAKILSGYSNQVVKKRSSIREPRVDVPNTSIKLTSKEKVERQTRTISWLSKQYFPISEKLRISKNEEETNVVTNNMKAVNRA